MILACGLACHRQDSPQTAFDHAHQAFLHGNLKQSQDEAHAGRLRFQYSDPEWAWKFRILEAESLLWRGMYPDVLPLLGSGQSQPSSRELAIEILTIEIVAHARLHEFTDAERDLERATSVCHAAMEATCGDVMRAGGVLAVQQGQIESARRFFEQSLQFARTHQNRFLEVTALINLGLTSLQEERFDEAVDRLEIAQSYSQAIGTDILTQKTKGNLGWAQYKLGDSDKALDQFLDAETRAANSGDIIDRLSWITNAGYVYADRGDLSRAKESYVRALDLATGIKGKKDIYNALRALALVSVESGELNEARKYSDRALDIARTDNNRLDELYPLLVNGLIAAKSHDTAEAERIFHEVDKDPNANASLKWRSEHALAQLYEDENHADAADREYRTALATFEGARSSLQRNDSKLPFSNNASRIYDDYIHFLVAHNKKDDALRWADYSRARTLAEGLGLLGKTASTGPPLLNPQQVARQANGTILFYWLGEKQSYLWAITPQKTGLFPLPPRSEIEASVERYRKSLGGPQDVLESSDQDGLWLYRTLVAPAQVMLKKDAKVVVIPDGSLANLNFETLLVSAPSESGPSQSNSHAHPHYWIEDATIANASSLRLLGATRRDVDKRKKSHDHSLLLVGDSVAPNSKYPELPKAAAQMQSVASHFPAADERIFARAQATPAAYLSSNPEQFSYIHFVAHGMASRLSPLDSAIILSKATAEDDSFKLYAREIIRHPLQANLVTIASCYGAGERTYAGEGLIGLSWAFLRAGAHNVIAASWEATDASTEQLMDKFYEELNQGAPPDIALRQAKLLLLHSDSAFHKPFYWAPFQLYAGS